MAPREEQEMRFAEIVEAVSGRRGGRTEAVVAWVGYCRLDILLIEEATQQPAVVVDKWRGLRFNFIL